MAISRYDNREFFLNDNSLFKEQFRRRNVGGIVQYSTPYFLKIEDEEYESIRTVQHVWKLGDRYSKLAEAHYDDPTAWWIIALFNKKPTESHIEVGDLIFIPIPLDEAMEIIGV